MKTRPQVARAIAIIAVVIIHNMYQTEYVSVFVRPFLNFATSMFVFLSGYLTKTNISDVSTFYKKRILRVLVPYAIWTLIYSLVYRNNVLSIVINLLTTNACYAFYFCFLYTQLVLITPLILKTIDKRWSWVWLLIQPIYLVAMNYGLTFLGVKLTHPLNCIFFAGMITYYYLGLKYKNSPKIKFTTLLVCLVVSIAIQIFEGMIWYNRGDAEMATTALKLSAMVTNIIIVQIVMKYLHCSKEISKIEVILAKLGDCSFGIYLSHVLIIVVISNKVPFFNSLPFIIKAVSVVLISAFMVTVGKKILGKKYSVWLGLN